MLAHGRKDHTNLILQKINISRKQRLNKLKVRKKAVKINNREHPQLLQKTYKILRQYYESCFKDFATIGSNIPLIDSFHRHSNGNKTTLWAKRIYPSSAMML